MPSKEEQLVAAIMPEFQKHLTPLQDAIKQLQGPASKMGMTPAQLMQKWVTPDQSVMLDGSGVPRIIPKNMYMSGQRVGYCQKQYDDGSIKGGEFGTFLKDCYNCHPRTKELGIVSQKDYDYSFGRLKDWDTHKLDVDSNGNIIRKAPLAESSGVTGGYTVPPFFYEQLMMLAVEESLIEKMATILPMTGKTLLVPSLDIDTAQAAGNSALLGGIQATWTSEASTLSESEPAFRQTELTAWQLSFISIASNTVLQDNAVSLDALLTQLFKLAIGWYKDYAFFQGNGVGKPLGILNAAATLVVTREATSNFTWYDATNMLSSIYSMLLGGKLAWFMHQTVLPKLLRMNDDSAGSQAGRVLFVPINEGASKPLDHPDGVQSVGKLLGHNVYLTEKLPALGTQGCVLLADVSKYLVGQRLDLEIDVSPHYKFANYQTTWRTVARVDGQPWLSGPITLADGTKQASAFVTLTQ